MATATEAWPDDNVKKRKKKVNAQGRLSRFGEKATAGFGLLQGSEQIYSLYGLALLLTKRKLE